METCYLPRVQRNLPWLTPCGWHCLQRGRSGRGRAGRTPGWPGPMPAGRLSCLPPPQGAAAGPGAHSLADEGAHGDVLQGPHAPAHVLSAVQLQPRPGKGSVLMASPTTLGSGTRQESPLETLHNCPRGERVTPRVTGRPLSSHLRSPESAPGTRTLALSVPVSSSATSTGGRMLLLAPGCGVGSLGLGQEQGLSQSPRAMAAHPPIVSSGPGGGRAPVLTPKDGHTR